MADERTTREISSRVDRLYVKRAHPFRRARLWLSVLALIVAGAWMAWRGFGRNSLVHNPGALASAHAMWTSNCAVCHDGAGKSSPNFFSSRDVSDNACLNCHDGAIHHPNQNRLISADSSTATNCMQCHTEHRGEALLRASDNMNCTQCHRDLPGASMRGAEASAQHSVTAFALELHPKFGRDMSRDGKVVDPTALKFNHKKHMPMDLIQNNCALCHNALTPQPLTREPTDKTPPPWKSEKDRATEAIASSDPSYMAPISYQRHCVACHKLDLPDGTFIPHEPMKVVRAHASNWPGAPASADTGRKIPGRSGGGSAKTVNEATLEMLKKKFKNDDALSAKLVEIEKTLGPAATQPSARPAAALAEFFVMFGSPNNCAYCHDINGVDTAPTGIPDAPRRWFASAQFDHAAHRNLSCISCHADATRSELTSDSLLPGIESCVVCHHEKSAEAAPANCVTCHQFHDRSRERPRDGRFSIEEAIAAPTSRPAAH